jgi:uncharacterized paraquat-inducible protein A
MPTTGRINENMNVFVLIVFSVLIVLGSSAPSDRTCEDRVPNLCQNELQAHYCYIPHNQRLCCQTCQQLKRTHEPDCPYGDHNTHIVRKDASGADKRYTCSGYVSFYGRDHCSREANFKRWCCESCKGQ